MSDGSKKKIADIRDIPIGGKRVILRSSLNAPLVGGVVTDDLRLERSLDTLRWLMDGGAKVGIIGHLGREGGTLKPVYDTLHEQIPRLEWSSDLLDQIEGDPIGAIPDGGAVVFENIRRNPGELTNDSELGKRLASYADIFVNDAFADSHRAHASIVGIPAHIPGYAGIAFLAEMEHLSRAMEPAHPSLCILGGAKFETKEPLVRALLEKYEHVLVAGALANDFFKAAGNEVGTSMVSNQPVDEIRKLAEKENIILPVDVIADGPNGKKTVPVHGVAKEERIRDAGPETITALKAYIDAAAFILWNGPLGAYEEGFTEGTELLAKAIAGSKANTIVGGGDTVAAIRTLNIADRFTFLSTAGGAMIDFLTDGTLPGIEVLVEKP